MSHNTPPDEIDPKGLIRESFRMDGITDAECRSILVDWALSLSAQTPPAPAMAALLQRHQPDPAHPMAQLLLEGRDGTAEAPRRRGGYRARPRGTEGAVE
jgi:hypothetical protein